MNDIFAEYEETFGPVWRDNLGLIPEHMREGMALYMLYGVTPGDFLYYILCNDFYHAAQRADNMNMIRLHHYCSFLYNYADPSSFGSPEKVAAWMEKGGARGKE